MCQSLVKIVADELREPRNHHYREGGVEFSIEPNVPLRVCACDSAWCLVGQISTLS